MRMRKTRRTTRKMKINKYITETNRWKGRYGVPVKWITIHYTAGVGDTAYGNCQYFSTEYRAASAHFFVDETSIWQSVELEDSAWHCGDAPSRNGCNNLNSIGIEMCSDKDSKGNYYISEETVANTVELVIYLLGRYPDAQLCRHYDVTGKACPMPWVYNEQLWIDFKERVQEGLPMTAAEKKWVEGIEKKAKNLEKKAEDLSKKNAELESQLAALGKSSTENLEAVQASIKGIKNEVMPKWGFVDGNMPSWMKPTIKKLVAKGYLKGDKNGNLQLSYQFARALVVLDRAGSFDK